MKQYNGGDMMKSVWSESCNFGKREELNGDIRVDVLVIGAGIAGILTGYILSQRGRDVVLIEKDKITSGNTKNTTAKITSQHYLIYDKLISEFGEEKARKYAKANELAIKKYKEIIEERRIDCDFEEVPAFVYSLNEVDLIKKEVEAAKRVGIDAEFVDKINLPLDIKGAVKFNNQAQFNPLKFLVDITKELKIYENTRAIKVEDNIVETNKGKIIANEIVVATHYPIINVPGFYFMKMHQERSYVIALENAQKVDGMYIDYESNGYSFRDATGFNKWGMTSSMVSAMIISDLITQQENDFSEIFSPHRFDLSLSIKNVAKDMATTAKNFIAQKVYIPSSEIEHIKNGHGGIVKYDGQKVGVYKDDDGKIFTVSPKCSHLGCELHWNADESTWDCPCHGSRFDYKGNLIDSPAIKNIKKN